MQNKMNFDAKLTQILNEEYDYAIEAAIDEYIDRYNNGQIWKAYSTIITDLARYYLPEIEKLNDEVTTIVQERSGSWTGTGELLITIHAGLQYGLIPIFRLMDNTGTDLQTTYENLEDHQAHQRFRATIKYLSTTVRQIRNMIHPNTPEQELILARRYMEIARKVYEQFKNISDYFIGAS